MFFFTQGNAQSTSFMMHTACTVLHAIVYRRFIGREHLNSWPGFNAFYDCHDCAYCPRSEKGKNIKGASFVRFLSASAYRNSSYGGKKWVHSIAAMRVFDAIT